MIELSQVTKNFGGVRAVDHLDLKVSRGQIFALIGPNGSGKSTTINLISGLYPLSSGQIKLDGQDISRLAMHDRAVCGLARTFQTIRLFGQLTVSQNLWVAQTGNDNRSARGFLERWFGGPRSAREDIARALEFAELIEKQDELASNLSFGEQRRLELARALATRPKLLLLDEPAAGMGADEIHKLRRRITTLRDQGMTILLVEHVMELVMGVADQIAVLNFGSKIAQGTPAEIRSNPVVQKAYLGGEVQ